MQLDELVNDVLHPRNAGSELPLLQHHSVIIMTLMILYDGRKGMHGPTAEVNCLLACLLVADVSIERLAGQICMLQKAMPHANAWSQDGGPCRQSYATIMLWNGNSQNPEITKALPCSIQGQSSKPKTQMTLGEFTLQSGNIMPGSHAQLCRVSAIDDTRSIHYSCIDHVVPDKGCMSSFPRCQIVRDLDVQSRTNATYVIALEF